MTFIASVVARDGVAIIADSLVTTVRPVLDLGDFLAFVERKASNRDDAQIDVAELYDLFENRASHTRDFEDKIFQYDSHTAITTAGNAEINGLRINKLVDTKIKQNNAKTNYVGLSIFEKVNDFCEFLEQEIKAHFENNYYLGSTTFIFTHFDASLNSTFIFKIETEECSEEDYQQIDFCAIRRPEREEIAEVVCDGQSRISNGILYGGIASVILAVNKVIDLLILDFDLNLPQIDDGYRESVISKCVDLIDDDIQLRKITDLSLQQAVNLAALLMKIEIDFQKYTENIPTVGGVVKIATIDANGFKFVSGHEIIRPERM